MNRYEVLVLAAPTITEDEGRSLEKGFEQLIKNIKGEIISFERWGKFRLAYPVRKNDFGIYFLTRFSIENLEKAFSKDIDAFFSVRNHELVMRHCVVKLEPTQSLEYKRPFNVEETPAHDAEGGLFSKEGREFRRGPRREYTPRTDDGFNPRRHESRESSRESSHEESKPAQESTPEGL